MELKFKCHNCGKEHILKDSMVYWCGQIKLSINLILFYKIKELEDKINTIEKYNKLYQLYNACVKVGRKISK